MKENAKGSHQSRCRTDSSHSSHPAYTISRSKLTKHAASGTHCRTGSHSDSFTYCNVRVNTRSHASTNIHKGALRARR